MSSHDSRLNSPPSTPAPQAPSSTENAVGTSRNPVRFLATSLQRTGSMYSGMLPRTSPLADEEKATRTGNKTRPTTGPSADSDPEGAGPPTPEENKDRSCRLLFAVICQVLVAFVFFSIIAIAAIASTSLLLSLVGATLLGLAKTSGGVYTNLTVVSLIVATVCGAAVITAAGAALILAFLPVSMCCGGDSDVVVELACAVALFGIVGATFFAPAIGIAVTSGDIIGLSQRFRATEAMRMNGVGLGGVLACVLAEVILGGIIACLEAPMVW